SGAASRGRAPAARRSRARSRRAPWRRRAARACPPSRSRHWGPPTTASGCAPRRVPSDEGRRPSRSRPRTGARASPAATTRGCTRAGGGARRRAWALRGGGCRGRRAASTGPGRARRTRAAGRAGRAGRGRARRGSAGSAPTARSAVASGSPAARSRAGARLPRRARGTGAGDPEVEHHVEPVPVGEVALRLLGEDVRLAEQHRVADTPLQELAELPEVLEVDLRPPARLRRLLEDERNGVDTEARDAELEPEADDPPHLLADARVVHVEVGLEVVEAVEVVRLRGAVERPRPTLDAGEDEAASPVRRPPLRPDVPVAVRRVASPRAAEPRVCVGGVVDDEVDQDADAAALGLVHELDEVARRAEARVDGVEVGDVVAVVAAGRGLERREPDRVDPEALDVVEAAGEAFEVAAAVAVRIHERLDVEAVD